ncbi:hypothetical protein ACFSJY_04040 [Thalassotalea euphylliae]|uniref:hypothetical protein n=1 Tax=Thalassotalea euphylliae TaxID=1655234 RepID=UPI0036422F12
MRIGLNGQVIPEEGDDQTVIVDRSSRKAWENSLLKLYQQQQMFPDDSGIKSQYQGELKAFAAEFPAEPEVVMNFKRGQDTELGFGPEFTKAARYQELLNLREHVLHNRHDATLEAAYREELEAYTEDYPSQTPDHIIEE